MTEISVGNGLSGPNLVRDWPSVTVIIPTLNCSRALKACLRSLMIQDYPGERIEIIVVDGGSSDDTVETAKSFGCKVISTLAYRENQEARRLLGVKESISDLVAFIDSDNILPHGLLLKKMVTPLIEDRDVFASETMWYGYSRELPSLTRYFALVGGIDPIVISLGKADRLPLDQTVWTIGDSIESLPEYYRVRFLPENLPTVGANGYVARRDVLLKSTSSPSEFFHIDINLDLVRQGYDTYAFVKDFIIHQTGNSLAQFLQRRVTYAFQFLFRNYERRRYKIYDPNLDRQKLLKYVLLSITAISPARRAIRGYKYLPDRAWFFHPIMSVLLTTIYSICFLSWAVGPEGRKRR